MLATLALDRYNEKTAGFGGKVSIFIKRKTQRGLRDKHANCDRARPYMLRKPSDPGENILISLNILPIKPVINYHIFSTR